MLRRAFSKIQRFSFKFSYYYISYYISYRIWRVKKQTANLWTTSSICRNLRNELLHPLCLLETREEGCGYYSFLSMNTVNEDFLIHKIRASRSRAIIIRAARIAIHLSKSNHMLCMFVSWLFFLVLPFVCSFFRCVRSILRVFHAW